jgi:hypothetical protein
MKPVRDNSHIRLNTGLKYSLNCIIYFGPFKYIECTNYEPGIQTRLITTEGITENKNNKHNTKEITDASTL